MDHLKIPLINYCIFFENSVVDMQLYKASLPLLEQYQKEHIGKAVINPDSNSIIDKISWGFYGLDTVPITQSLPQLKELSVPCNRISSLDFIIYLPSLEKLNVSNNLVEVLPSSIGQLKSLESLDLGFNLVKDINQFRVFKDCPRFASLVVRGNPFTFRFARHLDIIVSQISTLTHINDMEVAYVKDLHKLKPSLTLDLSLFDKERQVTCQTEAVSLDFSSRNIVNLQFQHSFAELKTLNMSHNGLTKLDGIQFLTGLVELNVENNALTDISDLGHLIHLKRIELGSNQITAIGHTFTGLKELVLFSIENNRITSLSGLTELSNLLELYIGENLVEDLKEIRHLGGLKKLIVLDLWGNPLCREKEFRLFCIFNVKELKVLDGYPIGPKEAEDSKQAFTGKLSDELLAEKLLGKNLETLVSLDLSACNLRDFDNIFSNHKFPKLIEINITGNFFTNMKCFGFLPTLKELNISDNRLATFEPFPDPKVRAGLAGLPVVSHYNQEPRSAPG